MEGGGLDVERILGEIRDLRLEIKENRVDHKEELRMLESRVRLLETQQASILVKVGIAGVVSSAIIAGIVSLVIRQISSSPPNAVATPPLQPITQPSR